MRSLSRLLPLVLAATCARQLDAGWIEVYGDVVPSPSYLQELAGDYIWTGFPTGLEAVGAFSIVG